MIWLAALLFVSTPCAHASPATAELPRVLSEDFRAEDGSIDIRCDAKACHLTMEENKVTIEGSDAGRLYQALEVDQRGMLVYGHSKKVFTRDADILCDAGTSYFCVVRLNLR